MDNNYNESRRPKKRVTKKMAQRRRLIALAVMVLILILGIVLICVACSGDDEPSGKKSNTPAVTTTTSVTTMVTTTTTAPVPTADPNDPNTITKIDLSVYEVYLNVGESKMPLVTMTPSSSTEKGEIWESSNKAVATVDWLGNITAVGAGECYVTVTSENNPIIYAEVKVVVTDPNAPAGVTTSATSAQSGMIQQTGQTQTTTAAPAPSGSADVQTVDEVTYIDGILIANKSYGLPADYAPGLDPTTESQFNALSEAAAQEGLNIWLASGYRSYEYQSTIYNNYSSLYGAETADTFSARPGHSEHQTGLAIDVNSIDDSFANTPEAEWLAQHAHEFGFIIRYPQGKQHITGYKYEPWHIRYLGVETATAVYNSGLTLEEYLGIDSVYGN
ncbi:MAG: D-alanyl-D-alanine carboxypeptidase family protein [Ruminococcus sp.]|nr:D-alanyl-D-alanine carboxypeptidase family protein [Ruminococcus sp.]